MQKRIHDWSEAMSALHLDEMVQVYDALLQGNDYPGEKIQSLIDDWFRKYGHNYLQQDKGDSHAVNDQPETKRSSETITRYDLNSASLYDGLAKKDSLGRQQLVDAMATILAARENTQHQTIGLLGDWGAGKSTFIKLLKDALSMQKEIEFLFAEFNAWEYEHTDNMQAGVAREALKGLVGDLGWWKKWWLAFKFSWQEKPWHMVITLGATLSLLSGSLWGVWDVWGVDWKEEWEQMLVAVTAGGVAASIFWQFTHSMKKLLKSPLVSEWKSYLSLPDYDAYLGTIPVMKRQIRALCTLRLDLDKGKTKKKQNQKRLLFVVDDLDRCSHSGVVKTFEAVRLIMGIPQVIVIIAIDHRIALASLALHYKELAQHHTQHDPGNIARDYLGKVIQLPVQLDAADPETIAAFVDEMLLNNAEGLAPEPVRGNTGDFNAREAGSTEPVAASGLGENAVAAAGLYAAQAETSSKPSSEPLSAESHVIEKVEYRFSPAENKVFKKRIKQFGFHNPRQLKRLYNSLNLLRHLHGSDQTNDHMLVLFWLEYLNSLSNEERTAAEKEGEAWREVQNHFEKVKPDYKTIKKQVEPFVLPALDKPIGNSKKAK